MTFEQSDLYPALGFLTCMLAVALLRRALRVAQSCLPVAWVGWITLFLAYALFSQGLGPSIGFAATLLSFSIIGIAFVYQGSTRHKAKQRPPRVSKPQSHKQARWHAWVRGIGATALATITSAVTGAAWATIPVAEPADRLSSIKRNPTHTVGLGCTRHLVFKRREYLATSKRNRADVRDLRRPHRMEFFSVGRAERDSKDSVHRVSPHWIGALRAAHSMLNGCSGR